MSKVTLDETGINQLQSNLYALTDPALFAEADAVRLDFVGWVDDHITLTSSQLDYLAGIDELFLDLLAIKTAIALRNRLPISLELASGTGSGKWFQDKDGLVPKWVSPGVITATGTLGFKTGY